MLTTLSLLVFVCLSTLNCQALDTGETVKSGSVPGLKVTSDPKDLDVSASNHAFLLGRDYGYGGSYAGSGSYGGRGDSAYDSSFGGYPGVRGGSVHRTESAYRGSGLTPDYRGYQVGGHGDGIIGGGHTGYGYYGRTGYGSGYSGYGSGGQNAYGGIGSGLYDTGYSSYGGTKGGYGVGYGEGYGNGYDGSYSRGYGGRDTTGYDSHGYQGTGGHGGSSGYGRYGSSAYQPSGYRGYS